MMTQGNMDLKVAPGSTGHSANHWGSLRSCFGGLIQFPQTLVWKNTLEMAVFTLILGFRPKLRSQNGPENVQNGPGYQVWMSTGGLEAISGHFINFKVSAFNFLKTTISKRYWPHPFISFFAYRHFIPIQHFLAFPLFFAVLREQFVSIPSSTNYAFTSTPLIADY